MEHLQPIRFRAPKETVAKIETAADLTQRTKTSILLEVIAEGLPTVLDRISFIGGKRTTKRGKR